MMLDFPRWKIALILGICLLFIVLALPNFLPVSSVQKFPGFLPKDRVSLGLDLRGGSHLLLQVEFNAYIKDQMAALEDEVRAALRKQKIGYRNLAAQRDRVTFDLRSPDDWNEAKEALEDAGLEVDIEREGGRVELLYTEQRLQEAKQRLLEQSIEIVNRRINETGTREPIIQRQGEDRILLQVPGLENPEMLKSILGRTAKMTFHMVDSTVDPQSLQSGVVPPGTKILYDEGNRSAGVPVPYAVEARPLLSGDLLVDAAATYNQNEPVVSFKFNTEGARKFGDITSENVGRLFAVVLDGKIITAPRINEPILGGSGIITGNFTVQSANELALLLRAGALPAPLKIMEERTVGPSLGADSVEAGKKASLVAIALVMLFMFISYGRFGVYANIALLFNMIMILACLSLFQASLTLPGIAGIVLTLGMAVDANVLIFERIREELRNGKSAYAAIESGFRMAFSTIVDSNLTTLIAAFILYYFGTGSVRGFAVTLSIGILTSMFSAIVLTRMMIVLWLKRTRPKTVNI